LATFLAGYLDRSFTKDCSWRTGTDMVREGIEEVRPFVIWSSRERFGLMN
jgi:hypothetical protein